MRNIFPRYLAYTIIILLLIQSINDVYFARCINTCITSFTLTYANATYGVMANE